MLPELFENVTNQLFGGIANEDEEEVKKGTEECEKRIAEYTSTYEAKDHA